MINFAALGAAFYYLVLYCQLPDQVLLLSPFLPGALATLVALQFPTLGINSTNYASYLTPSKIAGRVISYILFAPFMCAANQLDWTPYHDPIEARIVSEKLRQPLEMIAEEYGKRIAPLVKYGFLDKEQGKAMNRIYHNFKQATQLLQSYTKRQLGECSLVNEAKDQLESAKKQWEALTPTFTLPHPEIPDPDYNRSFFATVHTELRNDIKGTLDGTKTYPFVSY
jgi:hypothetical protein